MEQIKWPEGIKWTKQRKDVFTVLRQAKKPMSAYDIFQEILKEGATDASNYAISTVYRSLTIFEEKGLVEKNMHRYKKYFLFWSNFRIIFDMQDN